MKKTVSILVLLFCALSFITCDKKITRAIPAVSSCDFKDMSLIVVKTNSQATNLNVKKVLLEDYTGQWCGNCPKAARKAEQLQQQYGSRLVVMANHVTVQYAAPVSGDTLYQTDYRNEASTAWDNRLKISTTPGLPGGAVDRTIPYAVPIADFSSRVAAQLEVAAGALPRKVPTPSRSRARVRG